MLKCFENIIYRGKHSLNVRMKEKKEDSFEGLDVIMLIKQNGNVIKGNIKQFFFIICVISTIVCNPPFWGLYRLSHFERLFINFMK